MGACYRDGVAVIVHDLSEQLCARHHRNSFFARTGEFRIVLVDGGGVDDKINIIRDVCGGLTVVNLDTKML